MCYSPLLLAELAMQCGRVARHNMQTLHCRATARRSVPVFTLTVMACSLLSVRKAQKGAVARSESGICEGCTYGRSKPKLTLQRRQSIRVDEIIVYACGHGHPSVLPNNIRQ